MKILITGGAGFVGSNLAISLKTASPKWHIIAFDNLHRRGSEINLPRLKSNHIEFIHGDIRIVEDLNALGKFDALIECSAEPSVLSGYINAPTYLTQTNLNGTLNCLEACRKTSAAIIFLSTSRIYPIPQINQIKLIESKTRYLQAPNQSMPGLTTQGIDETFPLDGNRTLYGATKLCSELLIQEYINAYDMQGVINRCGVIAGPYQMGKVDQGFVALWIARHFWKKKLAYIGYGGIGKQVRDVLHIKDLFELVSLQLSQLKICNNSIFNVGGGNTVSLSLLELTQKCVSLTGNEIPIDSIEETRKGDIPYYISNCQKVELALGWRPKYQADDIVEDVYHWLKRDQSQLNALFNP